jgi:oligopeptide/dipeptide ABC transporter ATP-binding protein
MDKFVLKVEDLVTKFKTANGIHAAIRGVSFNVKEGETVCIVGESGSGKSITAFSILGLLPDNGVIDSGNIYLNDKNITNLSNEKMRKVRGNEISMIFQEPMSALNPVFTIGYQLREPLIIHQNLSKKEAHKKGIELLKQVGLPLPEKRMHQYPHELSGGMMQRVMISIALACNPKVLIADEPTTALDVTIQEQILELINDLKRKFNTSVVMITHDMGVVAEVADHVIVMYAGKAVEEGSVEEIFNEPKHPYTKALLEAVPDIDNRDQMITSIPGNAPKISDDVPGCRFHPRCKYVMDKCKKLDPKSFQLEENHIVHCWLQEEEKNEKNRKHLETSQCKKILSN